MRRHLLALVSVAVLSTACSGGEDEVAETTAAPTLPTTTTVVEDTTSTSTTVAVDVGAWPLTGLEAPDGVDPLAGPVLAVKVDNAPAARPQVGLEDADVVMEVLVEGGITRLIAVYQSQVPEEIGPVRSVREVDSKLIDPFDGAMAHSGGQDHVVAAVRAVAVDLGRPSLSTLAYTRDPERSGTHNLMLDPQAALQSAAEELQAAPGGLIEFDPDSREGEQALTVEIEMSAGQRSVYRWAPEDTGYLRFNGSTMHETASGARITPSNVVAVFVDQIATGRTDSAGNPVPDFDVVGTGRAVVFRDGVAVDGMWERGRTADFFRFFDAEGRTIGLAPGSTWLELVPTGRSVTWQ